MQFIVISPVKSLGEAFHASDGVKYLKEHSDYLREEITRLHSELDRERNEKLVWQEMFHKTLGISQNVERSRNTVDLKPVSAGRKPWKVVVNEFEKKEKAQLKEKEVNE